MLLLHSRWNHTSSKKVLGLQNTCSPFDCLLHAVYKCMAAKKVLQKNRWSYSLYTGKLRVRNSISCSQNLGGGLHLYNYTKTGTNTEADI